MPNHVGTPNDNVDFAMMGEFYSITYKIDQDLPKPDFVKLNFCRELLIEFFNVTDTFNGDSE
jgi:hypothetical protein